VVRALDALCELDERAARGPAAPDERRSWELDRYRQHLGNDQPLWQLAALAGVVDVRLDHEGRVFRDIFSLDMNLVENRDFDLRGELRFKATGESPCVLHFSGVGADQAIHQWGGFLGAY